MLRRTHSLFLLLLAIAPALGGCANPCEQLADLVCECGATRGERQACLAEVSAQQQSQPSPTAEQEEVCAAALVTCTCEDLANQRTDRCGFTRDPGAADEGAP
ncbi:MAG: hypothetical protein ACO3JL_09910 [Myxococcota bacterium]